MKVDVTKKNDYADASLQYKERIVVGESGCHEEKKFAEKSCVFEYHEPVTEGGSYIEMKHADGGSQTVELLTSTISTQYTFKHTMIEGRIICWYSTQRRCVSNVG